MRLNQNKFQFNIEAVSSYLSFRYPILDDTFFEGIYSLPPAHYIKVSDQKISKVEYWNASHKFKEQENDYGEEYYINKTRELLESAVKYRMISDVPFGAFLSGGVDISVITSIMAKNSDDSINTFTIDFEEETLMNLSLSNVLDLYNTNHIR